MRVFCFPSTDSGRTKVSPASAFLSARPFRRALPEALAPAGRNQSHVSAQSASDGGRSGETGGGRAACSPLQRVAACQRGLKCAISAVWQCHLAPAGHCVSLVRALVLGAARLKSHKGSSSVRGSPKSHAPGGEQLPRGGAGAPVRAGRGHEAAGRCGPAAGPAPCWGQGSGEHPLGSPWTRGSVGSGGCLPPPSCPGSARAALSRDGRTAAGP